MFKSKNSDIMNFNMNASPFSILHFSTADNEGGSARAAYRIHTGLRAAGHTSRMLTGTKVTLDTDVDTVYGRQWGQRAQMLTEKITQRLGWQYLWFPSSRRVLHHPWVKDADIIQLYNTHGGYFSHRLLPALSKRAPLVWRLSDMWPMTTHAAYSYGCECYKRGPDECVCELSSYPSIGRDTRKLLWRIKERVFAQSNITVVAPSSWTEQLAKESLLLGRFPVHLIPNGIDLDVFKPQEAHVARARFGIDKNAKVILFVAHGLDGNPRKGATYLIEALSRLSRSAQVTLALVGIGGKDWQSKVPVAVRRLGYISDDRTMAAVYSAADLIIAPSVVENLPNTVLEAMACGTPAVTFNVGGMKDAVRHMKTGYLAQYGNVKDLAYGIELLFNDTVLRERCRKSTRALMEQEFGSTLQTQRFVDLYAGLLSRPMVR